METVFLTRLDNIHRHICPNSTVLYLNPEVLRFSSGEAEPEVFLHQLEPTNFNQ